MYSSWLEFSPKCFWSLTSSSVIHKSHLLPSYERPTPRALSSLWGMVGFYLLPKYSTLPLDLFQNTWFIPDNLPSSVRTQSTSQHLISTTTSSLCHLVSGHRLWVWHFHSSLPPHITVTFILTAPVTICQKGIIPYQMTQLPFISPEHHFRISHPKSWSIPRRPIFLHALSFECNTKLCINFLNQFLFIFTLK